MKRLLLLLLAYAVGGAIINVAVAWGCALWSTAQFEEPPAHRGDQTELAEILRKRAVKVLVIPGKWTWGSATMIGVTWWQMGQTPADGGMLPLNPMHIHLAGWPLRSLSAVGIVKGPPGIANGQLMFDADWETGTKAPKFLKPKSTWFAVLPPLERPLPLSPLWPGFAINTIFYAAILWLLFAAPGLVRRRIRARRGQCPACGYPIGSSDVCTECGAVLPLPLGEGRGEGKAREA